MRWWGPKGFTAPFCSIDFRGVASISSACARQTARTTGAQASIAKLFQLERIVYTDSFADEKGNVVPATHYGMSADFPLEMLVTITFEEKEGKTKMTLRHVGIPSGPMSDVTTPGLERILRQARREPEIDMRKNKTRTSAHGFTESVPGHLSWRLI